MGKACLAIFIVVAFASLGAGYGVGNRVRHQPPQALVSLIESYAEGDRDEAVRRAAAADLGQMRLRFVQDVPAWIQADPEMAIRRRAAAAAFLLELTHARLETDWGRLSDLVEFACAGLRSAGPPSPFELAWHRASIALAARARARLWLLGPSARLPHQPPRRQPPGAAKPSDEYPRHLSHALERFPDDSQLRLAQVLAWTWGRDQEPMRNRRPRGRDNDDRPGPPQREAVVALRPLIDDPVVGTEVLVRLGHVHFTMDELPEALDELERAQTREAGTAVRYLAFFSAGRVLEAMGREDEAMAQYAKALEVVPEAESATVALASLQFVHDDREAAVSRLNQVFSRPSVPADPGRLVGYGSFIHWPALRDAMRAELPQ